MITGAITWDQRTDRMKTKVKSCMAKVSLTLEMQNAGIG